jgi:hypothetical protein
MRKTALTALALLVLAGCSKEPPAPAAAAKPDPLAARAAERLATYAPVQLTADLTPLTAKERAMLTHLVRAAEVMDGLFWQQAYGDKQALLASLADPAQRPFAELNYGPWDRLDGDAPFVAGVGPKPQGANFYPADMTKEEFEAAELPGKADQYSLVRRDAAGALIVVPYHQAFAAELTTAAGHLREAAALAEDAGLKRYLELRADALLSGEYRESDRAWLDMKKNRLDVVIGPIENYEDKLYGYRTAFEAYVLIKDLAWSERLAKYARYLPELQKGLPVPPEYRREMPGTNSDLNAYDVVYYAGDSNAGSKTIAINLPNDEQVTLEKGSRRLQLKNAMRAKFDKILAPIADELIVPEQRAQVRFEAFFANVMFHEVAHGLGVKNLVAGKGTAREALKESYGALEEGKADILGLYMITRLKQKGELTETELMDHYVTFLAGFFRSVRFGATSAHGRANMFQFNFLQAQGAFTRDPASGKYKVDAERFGKAAEALAARLLKTQGDGDYEGAKRMLADEAVIGAELKADLDRLGSKGIPVDIVLEQGLGVLGLADAAPAP